MNPEQIANDLEILDIAWAEADAKARELEELQKPFLMELAMQVRLASRSFSEAEAKALADIRYRNHLVGMVEARRQANLARARLNRMRTWIELIRTKEASERAMMGLR